MQDVLIDGMKGLGDNIYQRGFIDTLSKVANVYIKTPFPELYQDLEVKPVKSFTTLRTQAKNIDRVDASTWWHPPANIRTLKISYGGYNAPMSSIPQVMQFCFGVKPKWSLPSFGKCKLKTDKPIAIIRPATIRNEWCNPARNPKPEYIKKASLRLAETHHVVSVADIAKGEEWLVDGVEPYADTKYHSGELNFIQLMRLFLRADVVVGGVGWIVPASIVTSKKAFIILGGNGGYNAPDKLSDKTMNLKNMTWAMPDNFCECIDMKHQCDKTIINFDDKLDDWIATL